MKLPFRKLISKASPFQSQHKGTYSDLESIGSTKRRIPLPLSSTYWPLPYATTKSPFQLADSACLPQTLRDSESRT